MSESLRDQLLKSGLLQAQRESRPRENTRRDGPQLRGGAERKGLSHERKVPAPRSPQPDGALPKHGRRGSAPGATAAEIDLARAYALRAQQERNERVRAEREAAARAAARKAQRQQLHALLDGRALNREDAEHARHFEYAGKIRRVYVSAEQLREVNDGVLGVIQCEGRYLLVPRALAEQVRAFAPAAVALLAEPGGAEDDLPPGG